MITDGADIIDAQTVQMSINIMDDADTIDGAGNCENASSFFFLANGLL